MRFLITVMVLCFCVYGCASNTEREWVVDQSTGQVSVSATGTLKILWWTGGNSSLTLFEFLPDNDNLSITLYAHGDHTTEGRVRVYFSSNENKPFFGKKCFLAHRIAFLE